MGPAARPTAWGGSSRRGCSRHAGSPCSWPTSPARARTSARRRGGAPGQVDFTLGDFAVSMPQIRGGKMKGLGVTSPQRTPLAPELPAIAETFPGFETRIWYGLVAPANTPKAVVAKVYDVVTASLAKPE